MNKAINSFHGEFDFLSNFFECEIEYEGIIYPTVEHAFQAVKTLRIDERLMISNLPTAGKAKRAGRKVELRKDWEGIKKDVMYNLCFIKFQNDNLKQKLLKTSEFELIERNHWHDYYWGVCNGKGQNNLGKILMRIRDEIKK